MEARRERETIPSERGREVRAEPVPVKEVRTEPRVVVTTYERDEERERRKAKAKTGLLTAAMVVLAATLLTLGTTWHFAGKAKEGVQAGIEGIENLASKGKETLFGRPSPSQFEHLGSPSLMDKAKVTFGFGRHEALHKVREALGVESGKPLGPEDYNRLEELIRLDQYSHSTGFWDSLKEKIGTQDDYAQKVKSALGKGEDKVTEMLRKLGPEKDATQKLREALGLEDKSMGHDALLKLKELIGVEPDKPIGQDTLLKLKEVLGLETHEPGMWEKAKSKLHLGSEQPDLLQQIKNAIGADKPGDTQSESLMDKVKSTVGLGQDQTEKLITEAKQRAAESQEFLERAYAERKKEKAHAGGR